MRGRSFHATLTAAVVLLGSDVASRAQTDDFFADFISPETRSAALAAPVVLGKDAAPKVTEATKASTGRETSIGNGPGDSTGTEGLFDAGSDDRLDPTDWTPEHSPVGTIDGGGRPRMAAKATDKGLDPEPDVAIKPPPVTPSKDPLDAARPGASKPALAEQPLPLLNAAIKAALDKREALEIRGAHAVERRKEREAIAFFYAAHGFAPVWSENGAPVASVASVLARLAHAGDDALSVPMPPATFKGQGTPEAVADAELALSEAVVSYARQATGSRVDPRAISPLIGAKPDLADPAEVLDAIAAAGAEAGDKLEALNPIDPRYVALRQKLADMHAAHALARAPIPVGPTLKIGMHDPRVPLIRARFGLDVVAETDLEDLRYDLQIAEAVSGFQRANGLPVSGQLTKRTIAALSGRKPSRLEGTLAANMEMWRWMPRDLGADRIEVNVPDYTVTVFHDGEPVARNRVVVGKTDTPTPLFSNTMKYLIVNPVWNVPDSIIEKEMIPKGGGARSIKAHGFDVSYRNGKLVVKQPSGAKNALGRIKFMFPNDYSVYLHDTPSKALFAASKRAFSHGCVRVDQPFDFAESVLNDGVPEGGRLVWGQKRLQAMLGDRERYVYLPKPLPIHIEYFTASVDPDGGRVQLRDDVYGYAHGVGVALGEEGEPARIAERKPRRMAERGARKAAPVVDDDGADPR